MWKTPFNHVNLDPATKSVGTALLCIILAQRLSTRQPGLYSGILGWLLLPFLFRIERLSKAHAFDGTNLTNKCKTESTPAITLWIVAFSIAGFCWYRTEYGLVGFFPVLTPLLLDVQKHCLSVEPMILPESNPRHLSPFVNTAWGTTLVASFTVGALSNWDIRTYIFSAFPVIGLLLGYTILISSTGKSLRFLSRPLGIEHAVRSLALRVVAILAVIVGVEAVVFGFPRSDPVDTATLGLVKACELYSILHIARDSSWVTTTIAGTFGIMATRDPLTHSSDLQAASHVVATLLILSQVGCVLPKQAKIKLAVCIFSIIALTPYAINFLDIQAAQSSMIHSQKHPVEDLISKAHIDFDAMIKRQSKSLTAAADEYRRRYRVEPPPGFDDWYEFARSHQSPIIDDFDTIYAGVSPFWKLSGRQVLETMDQALRAPGADLWHCVFSGRQATTQCHHPYRASDRDIHHLFDHLLHDLPGILPDVKFLVNHLDEPRVLIPSQLLQSDRAYLDDDHAGRFDLTDKSGQAAWNTLTKFCPSSPERAPDVHMATPSVLPFVSSLSSAIDLCRHPEYRNMHGLAISPATFRPFQGLVPILSTGASSTMADILYPSPAYLQPEFQYNNDSAYDVPWTRKRNNLYWAGSTTGGFAGPDAQWQTHHRQRFVQLAQNLNQEDHLYLQEDAATVTLTRSSFLNGRLFDVAFTRLTQCAPPACRAQRKYFTTQPWVDKDYALGSRLVFDLDGNGISGRYYKLLASRSAPLKQTLFREWHDDRLVPWVHYVPVSLGIEELPELVSYLTSTEAGRAQAQEIAEQGRSWFFRALRDVDMAVYTYRLLLELARLQDPEREAGDLLK